MNNKEKTTKVHKELLLSDKFAASAAATVLVSLLMNIFTNQTREYSPEKSGTG